MKLFYLIAGAVIVAVAFQQSRKLGAILLVLVVLGMLKSASDKGVIT